MFLTLVKGDVCLHKPNDIYEFILQEIAHMHKNWHMVLDYS